MKLRLVLSGSIVLLLAACPSEEDEPEGEAGSSGSSSPSTSATASASASNTSTSDTSSSMTATSTPTTSEESSTGEEGCAVDRDPAPVTDVEGCEAPIGEPFCSEGQPHVEDGTEIVWQNNPPHSGPHYPMWQTWGEHAETVPRGNWVHNLEHGGIVLAYLCPDDCTADLDVLREVIAARPTERILMTSDPSLPAAGFAAISWTWVHMFDAPDLDTLLCFVDQHEGNAPEDVP